jgi:hypothetical protein
LDWPGLPIGTSRIRPPAACQRTPNASGETDARYNPIFPWDAQGISAASAVPNRLLTVDDRLAHAQFSYTTNADGISATITGYTGPAGTVDIPNEAAFSAFDGCARLTGVTIPDSVTSMGEFAFAECANLINVEIPGGVTNIPEAAFDDCTSLTNIAMPVGVVSIGDLAFTGCSALADRDEIKMNTR